MDEEAPASSPFAPRAALVRTPPSSLAPQMPQDSSRPVTPVMPVRPPRQRSSPTTPASQTAASTMASKRPLTSPEERRPVDVVRMCRPSTPTTAAAPRPSAPVVSSAQGDQPQSSCPITDVVSTDSSDDDEDNENEVAGNSLKGATKEELLDRVHRDLGQVMSVVTGHTSRLNKAATNAISMSCQGVLAVIGALALRLGEAEIRAVEANLRTAKAEQEVLRAKMAAPVGVAQAASSTAAVQPSYASTLRLGRKAEPIPIPAAQGPVLAFYPAPEHAETFKSAEDTKKVLKSCFKPEEHQVQVERLRKVGNAGVVVQTTNEASAEKLRNAVPATLRVTEPRRRAPLVSLRHIDGDGDLEFVYHALHDQNFRDTEWTQERIRSQSKLAFKKRGRGTSTVVLECSPQLREALLKRERVYIGWQVIEVMDYLSVTCCRKCHVYGHPEKYCRSTEVFCGRCGASGHRGEECSSPTENCATCKRFNRPDAAQHATGSAACPARQYAESRSLNNTNYGQ